MWRRGVPLLRWAAAAAGNPAQQRAACSASAAAVERIDHAALGVRDLGVSKAWYASVVGLLPFREGDPLFSDDSLAMVQRNDALVALLKLPEGQAPLVGSREQKGHVAFRVTHAEIRRLHKELPALLLQHRARPDQTLEIDVQDYGAQLSLFCWDPDGNEVEFAAWVDKDAPLRFG